jgi:hypothetical protein
MARFYGAIFLFPPGSPNSYCPLRCRYFRDWSGSIERKRLSKLLVSGFEIFGAFGPPSSPAFRSHGLSVDGVLCICSGMGLWYSKNRATYAGSTGRRP